MLNMEKHDFSPASLEARRFNHYYCNLKLKKNKKVY